MLHQPIATINGVGIVTVEHDGEIFVPIKPICRALSIYYPAQRQRIMRHYILSSTVVTLTTVAADDKDREMLCLPLEFVYGWLFTIDADLVAESRREQVAGYQRECYEVLYRHFAGSLRRRVEENEAEIAALQAVNAALLQVKEAKAAYRKAEDHLAAIRKSRLDPIPLLPLK